MCALALLCALAAPIPALAAGSAVPITAAQVERGAEVYLEHCLLCHGNRLNNGQFGVPLKGSFYRQRWTGKNAAELLTLLIDTMPPAQPGGLDDQSYVDVMAYILEANGVTPGEAELPIEIEALEQVPLP